MSGFDLTEVKELAKRNDVSVVMVGGRVYEASKYAPDLVYFTSQKYLFLNHFYAGMPLGEAALKAGLEEDQASEFLETPKAMEYLRKRAIRDYIKREYEEGKWLEVGEDCLSGKKHLAKDQQVVFSAFGERFAPKPKATDTSPKTVINFNFSSESVKEAFRRQESIEAKLTEELEV